MTDPSDQTRPQQAGAGAWGGATPAAGTVATGAVAAGTVATGSVAAGTETPAAAAAPVGGSGVSVGPGTGSAPADGGLAAAAPTVAERADAVRDRAEAAVERAGEIAELAGDAIERAAAASGRVATAVIDRLRNDAEYPAERGSTRIEDEVVEKIAGIAAREVPGVHDLGGDTARFFASVKERVGLGEGGNRGVSARLEGRNATIEVTLVVEYGVPVYPVTEQVRAKVIEAVETMLDLRVIGVDVVVDDVEVPEPRR